MVATATGSPAALRPPGEPRRSAHIDSLDRRRTRVALPSLPDPVASPRDDRAHEVPDCSAAGFVNDEAHACPSCFAPVAVQIAEPKLDPIGREAGLTKDRENKAPTVLIAERTGRSTDDYNGRKRLGRVLHLNDVPARLSQKSPGKNACQRAIWEGGREGWVE
jgi:hypothetical protein